MESATIDYLGLLLTVAFATALASIGVAIDRFLLPRERNFLTERLTTWWIQIEDLSVPDAPRAFANLFLRVERAAFGERFSRRWVLSTIILSCSLTFATLLVGDLFFHKTIARAFSYHVSNPRLLLYPLNYVFDLTTMLLTIAVMIGVTKSGNFGRAVLIVADIALAFGLAYLIYTLAHSIEFWGQGYASLEPTGIQVAYAKMDMQGYWSYWKYFGLFDWDWPLSQWLIDNTNGWFAPHPVISTDRQTFANVSNFFPANTSLLPTMAYLLLLGFILGSVATIRVIRTVALRLLELDIETDKSIFFYTASLIGLVAVLGKSGMEILKLV